jgi:uncharacterized membrane protein
LAPDVVYCSSCGTPVSAQAGRSSEDGSAQPRSTSGMELPGIAFNVAGLLSYLLWPVAGIFFLLAGPYNRSRFVRFHAFQALFLGLGAFIVAIALQVMTSILALIPILGWIAGVLIWIAYGITILIVAVMLMYKAYNGEQYSVAVIGNLARQQSEKMA